MTNAIKIDNFRMTAAAVAVTSVLAAPTAFATWHHNVSDTSLYEFTTSDKVFGGSDNEAHPGTMSIQVTKGGFDDIHGGGYMTVRPGTTEIQRQKDGDTSMVINVDGFVADGEIYGGGYLQGEGDASYEGVQAVHETGSTSIIYNSGNSSGMVLGGARNIALRGSYTAITGNTFVQINGGNVAEAVIGGGLARTTLSGDYSANAKSGAAKIEIHGGSVDGIIGGGLSQVVATGTSVYTSVVSSQIDISAGTVEKLNVNGTTFDPAAVFAGGVVTYRGGSGAVSRIAEAGNAVINVHGGTINGDIYGGGMIEGAGTADRVKIGTTRITLSGGTVNGNVYSGTLFLNAGENAVSEQTGVVIKLTGDAKVTGDIVAGDNRVNNPRIRALTAASASAATDASFPTTIIFDSRDVQVGGVNTQGDTTGENVRIIGSSAFNDSFGSAEDALDWMRGINGLGADDGQAFTIEEGLTNDAVIVTEDGVRVQTNTLVKDAQALAVSAPLQITRILTNDVRKRLGDIRSSSEKSGVWARYDGGKMSGEGLSNKFNTVQIGADTIPADDSLRFGLAFSYTEGDADFRRGSSDLTAYSLAAYGTWMADSGAFADVVARMGTARNELNVDSAVKGKTDTAVLSLSGEFGWHFDVNSMLFAEPQFEVNYTYVDSDSFKLASASYDTASTDSLTARLGAAFGVKCPNNRGNAYLRASVVHEFLGDTEITSRNGLAFNRVTTDGKDTWFEYGIGANFNITPNTYVWADVERTAGAVYDEDWRGTVGVRYSF